MSAVGKVVCRLGELHRGVTGNEDGESMDALKGQEENTCMRALVADAAALGPVYA